MSNGALLNLVRLNVAEVTAPDHIYTSGEVYERHEEIKLLDPDGVPCAIPLAARYKNLDYKFNYITGDKGEQLVQLRRDLSINIDYIDSEVASLLEHWLHQRAHILVCPNFGRNTDFAFRPLHVVGTSYPQGGTFTDLTGNHPLTRVGSSYSTVQWDHQKRRFMDEAISGWALATTPGGAGLGFTRGGYNKAAPPYPLSASSGGPTVSGWRSGGTHSSDITRVYDATGFGYPACPATVKYSISALVSASRYIHMSTIWQSGHADYQGYTFTGGGQATATVWMRGQLPEDASLAFGPGSDLEILDLGGRRFNGWTPVTIVVTRADFTSGGNIELTLRLNSSIGMACTIEIGPVMVQHEPDEFRNPDTIWSKQIVDTGIQATKPGVSTTGNYTMPGSGTFITSFWVNPFPDGLTVPVIEVGLLDHANIAITMLHYPAVVAISIFDSTSGDSQALASVTNLIKINAINTVAYVWGGGEQVIFVNGERLGIVERSTKKIHFVNGAKLFVGQAGTGPTISPHKLLSARIDEGAMTDNEVKNIHLALTDPIALQFALHARGRIFRLSQVPQMLRASASGSQILGTIVLEQVGLYNQIADPQNVEDLVR